MYVKITELSVALTTSIDPAHKWPLLSMWPQMIEKLEDALEAAATILVLAHCKIFFCKALVFGEELVDEVRPGLRL